MSHGHVSCEDARRFSRFAVGVVRSEDPTWIAEYAANVRFCGHCADVARRANRLLLPEEFEGRSDPTGEWDNCLSLDDMMTLEEGTTEWQHLQYCAACQLLYYEAVALSAIVAVEHEEETTEASEPERICTLAPRLPAVEPVSPVLQAGFRVAASFGSLILGSDLVSGLLGPGEDEPVAEAVVREGHALKDVRIELDDETKTLVVAALPPSYPAQRLRLRVEDELLEPETLVASKARFDLSGVWHDGDHNFELVLVEP